MSIKRTIITTIVALALVAVVAPVVAKADTLSDLMAEIATLTAELNTLKGATAAPTTGACAGVTFTRNLTVGSTGTDVKCLQVLLNTNGYTLATTGAGSSGHETSYFGPATLKGVKAFQVAKGFVPANQVGPLTRGALNALLGTAPVTTLPAGCTSTSGFSPTTGASCSTGQVYVTPTGSGLQVQLAADNPASGTIVVGSALTPLAKYVFVNGDNAPVTVTSFKVNRTGVSADTDLQNVYLLQGATRITDAATVSSGVINFNNASGLFTVPSGSSVEITVAADILGYNSGSSEASAGETVGISLISAASITTNASSVKGNFPVNGNMMTTAGTYQTLATVAFGTSSTPSSTVTINPQPAYPIWQNTVTVGTRTVNMTRIAFRLIGSVQPADLQNFVLNVDGTNVGSSVKQMDSNGYVTFDLSSSPLVLQATGHTVKLIADIVNGSSHTLSVSIRVQADANFVDSQYGAIVQPYVSSQGTWTLADLTTGVQTIASGTLTLSRATTSPSGNVVLGASNVPLADYTLTAAGEPIKVTDMYFCIVTSSGTGSSVVAWRNGALYANGVQVGSTANIAGSGKTNCTSTDATHFSLGSALVVTPGSPLTLEVRADIHEVTSSGGAANVTNADQIYADLIGTSTYFTAQDMVSLATPTAPSTTAGNTLTVAQGSLSLAKYGAYTNQTIVVPQTGYMLGHFTLTGSTTEATNINTINLDLNSNTTTITNLYVKYGVQGGTMNQTTSISNPTKQTGTAGTTAAANSYYINWSLPAGQTADLEVFGDVNSLATPSVITYVGVDGTTASSVQTVHSNGIAQGSAGCNVTGQTITFGNGSFVGTKDSSTPPDEAVAGGSPVTAGIFQFTAKNDSYTINELKFSMGSGTTSAGVVSASAAITGVALKDAVLGTLLSPTVSVQLLTASTGQSQYVASFTGLSIPVSAGIPLSIAVVPTLASNLSSDAGNTNVDVEPYLTYVKASNSSGTPSNSDTTSSLISTPSVNKTFVFKAIPSIVYNGVNSKATTGSQVELYNTKVSATAGTIKVKQMKFYVTVTSPSGNAAINGSTYLNNFVFLKNGVNINTSVTIEPLTAGAGNDGTHDKVGVDLKSTNTIDTNTVIVTFLTEDSISSGSTTTYQLMASANNFQPGISTYAGDSIATYMPYNATYDGTHTTATSGTTLTGGQLEACTDSGTTGMFYVAPGTVSVPNTFIWSDNSAGANNGTSHGYAAAGSTDWYNSYLILTGSTPVETVTPAS